MKYHFIVLSLTLTFHCLSQQNLVQNPGFELYDDCPEWPNQVGNAYNWSECRQSPDYFNACYTGPGNGQSLSIPSNFGGFQTAASGQAYVGLATAYGFDYREFVGQVLNTPLVIGTKYYCSMKVSPGFNVSQNVVLASNKVGFNFSTAVYGSLSTAPITNSAKVYAQSIISDTANWTTVFGSFTADSAYNYLMLGNFFDASQTSTLALGSATVPSAYYYIDDVCVSTDSLYALNYEYDHAGSTELNTDANIDLFPNPSSSIVKITTSGNDFKEVIVHDQSGILIFQEAIVGKEYTLDISTLVKGVYFVEIVDCNENVTHKEFLKQ